MSSHLRSLERRNLVLGILAVVLVLILVFRPDNRTSVDKDTLPLVFTGFDTGSARRIDIERSGGPGSPVQRISLQRAGDGNSWTLASHHDYPTQAGAQALLDAVASARLRSEVTRRGDTFDKYADAGSWTTVTIIDTQGKDMVTFALGRYAYPDAFVRLGSGKDQRVVKATNIKPADARPEARSWIETRIWPELTASTMLRLDVEQRRDGHTITIVKRGASQADVGVEVPAKGEDDEQAYWMTSPEEGPAKRLAVEDLAREFSGALIQDIVAGGGADEAAAHGLDDPEIVATFWRKDGDKLHKNKYSVGKKTADGTGWYAQREGAPWVFTVSSTSISRMRQLPDEFRAPAQAEPAKDEGGKDEGGKDEGGKDEGGKDEAPKKDGAGDPDGDPAPDPKKDPEPKKDEPKKDEPKKDDGDGK